MYILSYYICMALLLLSIVIIGFVLFFYGIGLWFFALIPLIFIGMFFGYYGATQTIKVAGWELLKRYALYFARVIILAWLTGVFNFFGLDLTVSALGLLSINLLLRIVSVLVDYQDGKAVFQLWFYLSMILLLIIALAFWGWITFFNVFSMLWVLHLGIVAFMVFVVGLHKGVEKYLRYTLGILSLGTIFLTVFDQIKNVYLALTINSLILTVLFYLITKVFQLVPVSDTKKKEVSIRRILAGERITVVKKQFRSPLIDRLYRFLETMPNMTKQILELFNVILIFVLIVYYITHIGQFVDINHLRYRITIISFVVNVLLLKKVGYNSIIQNLFVFLVVNFAIYVSLFSYFKGDAGAVVSWWIIRNIVSSSMIFYAHKVPMLAKIFGKTDYIYWIISCVAAMIINVVLLLYTQLAGELIFFLVLVYVGLQSMIIFYAAKYLSKISIE